MLLSPQLIKFLFTRNTNVNCATNGASEVTNYIIITIIIIIIIILYGCLLSQTFSSWYFS